MRILRVTSTMDPSYGGPSQGIINFIPALKVLDVDNEVVCLDDPESDFIQNESFPIHALGHTKGTWWYSSKLIPWLLENLQRFDVIIVHGLWRYPGYAVWKALENYSKVAQNPQKNSEIPYVFVMPHGMLDPYFQQARGRELKAIRNWFYYKLITNKILHDSDGLLFTCEEELLLAQKTFKPYQPKREINIGYGVADPPPFTEAMKQAFLECCPNINNLPYILFLGRIDKKKGVELLIEAYSKIMDQSDDFNKAYQIPALVIAGPGLETSYGREVQRLVHSLPKTSNHIFFPGMLTKKAKWGAFYGCDAFILPSHQENFGIAVVEAMACGKPVLISNQVNIWREIEKAGGGIVADDTLQGTEKLLSTWKKLGEEEKIVFGHRAKKLHQTGFNIEIAASRFVNTLEKILAPVDSSKSKKQQRILHVIQSMDPKMGGVCQAVRSIIRGLSTFGITNEVVCFDTEMDINGADDFPIHRIDEGIGPWHYNRKLIPWLVANFSRFDSVILHGMWLYHAYASKKAVKIYRSQEQDQKLNYDSVSKGQSGLRFFVMPHGMLDPYFQKAKSRKLKAIRNWFYWKLFEAKVINSADAILFTCEEERRLAYQPFQPYHPKKEIVVGLGIESPPLYVERMLHSFLEKCPKIANARYLLFLSRIDEKKGVDILIKAYAKLLKESNRYKDLKLVIAGPGLDSNYGKIVKKIVLDDPQLKEQVFFSGMLTDDAKWGAFYGCEAFVLPSHQENFGIAVVEALACGKPVLISNQINIWREIEQSGGGIVADNTIKGTEKSIKYWFELNKEEKKEIGKMAGLCFEKNFTKDQAADRFLSAIKELD